MDFIFFIDRFPDLTKQSIDQGLIPANAISLANYFRSVFLLSNEIRKNNNIFIYAINQFPPTNDSLIIAFHGAKLRFLSPDERSTLFLFNNIIKIAQGNTNKKLDQRSIKQFCEGNFCQSTPGIRFKRGKFADLIKELIKYRLDSRENAEGVILSKSNLIIFDRNNVNSENDFNTNLISILGTRNNQKIWDLSNINENLSIIDEQNVVLEEIHDGSEISLLRKEDEDELVSFIGKNCNEIIRVRNSEINRKLHPWEQIIVLQSLLDNQ